MEATKEVELIEEEASCSESSDEEEKKIPNEAHLRVTGNSTIKAPLHLSVRMSTTTRVFEKFDDIDIHQTTFHSLVEKIQERRDLTDNGI